MKNLTLIGSTYKVQRQNEIMTKVTQNQRTIEIAKQRYQSMTYIRFYGNYTICRVKFIRPHVNAQYGFTIALLCTYIDITTKTMNKTKGRIRMYLLENRVQVIDKRMNDKSDRDKKLTMQSNIENARFNYSLFYFQ